MFIFQGWFWVTNTAGSKYKLEGPLTDGLKRYLPLCPPTSFTAWVWLFIHLFSFPVLSSIHSHGHSHVKVDIPSGTFRSGRRLGWCKPCGSIISFATYLHILADRHWLILAKSFFFFLIVFVSACPFNKVTFGMFCLFWIYATPDTKMMKKEVPLTLREDET